MVRVDMKVRLKKPIVAWKVMGFRYGRVSFQHQGFHHPRAKVGVPMRAKEKQLEADDGLLYTTGFHTYASRADARRVRRGSHLRVVKVLIWGPATYGVQKAVDSRNFYGYTARFMKILPLRKEGGA